MAGTVAAVVVLAVAVGLALVLAFAQMIDDIFHPPDVSPWTVLLVGATAAALLVAWDGAWT